MKIERVEHSPEACAEIFAFLGARMHPEVGVLPLNVDLAAAKIDECVRQGIVFNARQNGELIGSLGAMIGPHVWYSAEEIIGDLWFYVVPEARLERVGVELLLALRKEADKRKLRAIVGIVNPRRKQRQTFGGLVAQIAGYKITGHLTGFDHGLSLQADQTDTDDAAS